MENAIKEIFSDEIVDIVATKYGINNKDLKYIGGFQNFVYEYQLNGMSYILRFTPSTHRILSTVKAELEWILYLSSNGMSVSTPIYSTNGVMTEVVNTKDMYFTAVSFEKAQGKKIGYPECLQDNILFEKLGRMTGRIHSLSKLYKPKEVTVRRHDWNHNYYLKNINFIPAFQTRLMDSFFNLISTINELPKDEESYGLIHGDIGVGNFLISEQGTITLFDFDEAQYSWFVEDIAIQLYYLVYVYGGEEGRENREEQASRFMKYFMEGYRLENTLDDCWLNQIPLFLRLRELIVYIGAFRNFDGDETFSSSDNQWFKDWIAESKIRLENGVPLVNIWGR